MIVLILYYVNHSFCADLQITIAQGIGNNPDAALKNALHQAVQQVVGTLVNSESLVKNDDLIKEEILTHSNGFVKNYQVLKKIHPLSNGMYSVTIKAEVVEQKLKERLKNINVTQVTLNDMHNVWAQIESQNIRKDSAEKFLIKTLNKLYKTDFLQAVLVDKNGNKGYSAVPSIIPTANNSKVIFSIGAIIKFNQKKFMNEVQPALSDIFKKICADKSEPVKLLNNPGISGFRVNEEGILSVSYNKRNVQIISGKISVRRLHPIYTPQALRKKWLTIALNESKSCNSREQYFVRYYFPRTNSLRNFMGRKVTKNCWLTLLLKDSNGKILKQYSQQIFAGHHNGNSLFHKYSETAYGISPEIAHHSIFSNHKPVVIKFEMNTSDVKNIKSMHIFVSEDKK